MHEYASQEVELLADSPHLPIEDVLQKLATAVYGQNAEAILEARASLGAPDARVADLQTEEGSRLRTAIGRRSFVDATRLHSGTVPRKRWAQRSSIGFYRACFASTEGRLRRR